MQQHVCHTTVLAELFSLQDNRKAPLFGLFTLDKNFFIGTLKMLVESAKRYAITGCWPCLLARVAILKDNGISYLSKIRRNSSHAIDATTSGVTTIQPGFHAIFGADNCVSFYGKEKPTCWKAFY